MEKVTWSFLFPETSKTSKHLRLLICWSIALCLGLSPGVRDVSTNTETETPLCSIWATRTWARTLLSRCTPPTPHRDCVVLNSLSVLIPFQTSGDYIGMAFRHKVLICVYKLGGVVHEVETSQTTKASAYSSNMDRVVFHRWPSWIALSATARSDLQITPVSRALCRVYQDAEVHIVQNFTSQQPVQLSPKRNLPNTTSGVLGLDPHSLAFYVGGYPEDFRVTGHSFVYGLTLPVSEHRISGDFS